MFFENNGETMEKVIVMNYNEQAYLEYIDELRYHLFGGKTLEEIFIDIADNHRKKRFAAMYLLRDPETFHAYYERRDELGLSDLFNEIISTLFYHKEKLLIKRKFISRLNVNMDMITSPVPESELKVLTKDLQSFVWHATKAILMSPVS